MTCINIKNFSIIKKCYHLKFLLFYFLILITLIKNFKAVSCNSLIQTEIGHNYRSCRQPNNDNGVCIPLVDCLPLYELLSNITDENKLYLQKAECDRDKSQTNPGQHILVCCPEIDVKKKKLTMTIPSLEQTPGNELPKPGVCGAVFHDRIYGGNLTKIDEFPWMALIRYELGAGEYNFLCGGVLINTRYVLTAGHCIKHPELSPTCRLDSVRLGEWDIGHNPDCEVDVVGNRDCAPPHQDILIESYIVHENYDPSSIDQFYDISLIRLQRSVVYSDYIVPICLPMANNLRNQLFVNTSMDVAGWGLTEKETGSTIKLKISIPVWEIKKCSAKYKLFQFPINEDLQLCAGGVHGVDTCRGDSGGPLMGILRSEELIDAYHVVGIVSYGPRPCGLRGWPGVYTRVSYFIDWISSHLKP